MNVERSRRRPGEVRDAIEAFLKGRDGATTAEILASVEAALGGSVAPSSVRSYLRLNTPSRFERIARGRYRLPSE